MTDSRHLNFAAVEDTFSDDTLLLFQPKPEYGDVAIGVAEWLIKLPPYTDKELPIRQCLEAAWKAVSNTRPFMNVWLLLGDCGWRPDNRIQRYKRLLKSPLIRDLCEDKIEDCIEIMQERPNEIRYTVVLPADFQKLTEISRELAEYCCILIATRSEPDWHSILDNGMPNWKSWKDFVASRVAEGSAVFRRYGDFDEIRALAQVIAPPALIRQIRNEHEDLKLLQLES